MFRFIPRALRTAMRRSTSAILIGALVAQVAAAAAPAAGRALPRFAAARVPQPRASVAVRAAGKNAAAEWPSIYNSLVGRLKPITGAEAMKMTKDWLNPAVVVDVRAPKLYNAATIEGAVNVPLFLPIEGFNLKRLVTNSMGVEATERNPDFEAMALERLPKGKPIIVACDRGGLLNAAEFGGSGRDNLQTYTRSLRAAADLYDAGFNNLFFLKDGIDGWDREGLPMTEEALAIPHSLIPECLRNIKYLAPAMFTLAMAIRIVLEMVARSPGRRSARALGEPLMRA